jgi:hypothetical protein
VATERSQLAPSKYDMMEDLVKKAFANGSEADPATLLIDENISLKEEVKRLNLVI